MDWFNNRAINHRATDAERMLAVMVSLKESKASLTAANQFVARQTDRAIQLSAVQGVSNSTSQFLKQAMDDLAYYERGSRKVNDGLDRSEDILELVIEQYRLPKGQRIMNLNGSDMVNSVIGSAVVALDALIDLKSEHMADVSSAVGCIDNADRELNGPLSNSEIDALPDLTDSVEAKWLQN